MNIVSWARSNQGKIWAWTLGIGLVLYGIHNQYQPLIKYAFLPTIGLAISLLVSFTIVLDNRKNISLGSKWVYIPMIVIAGSIAISGLINGDTMGSKLAPAMFAVYLLSVYIASRILGRELFKPFIFAVVVIALSCIVSGMMNRGIPTGGLITNYCASAGFIVLGVTLYKFKYQWLLVCLALLGLFFIGALEAVFAVAALGIIVLARKDWSKKILLPIGLVVLAIVTWTILGFTVELYTGNKNVEALTNVVTGQYKVQDETVNVITTNRWEVIKLAMSDIKPFGHGYKPGVAETYTVHNLPLIIVDQVGILAGAAWLIIVIFCLIKTKWKYAWSAVIVLSVFDHFIWTQFAPYWWALAGVSTVSAMRGDYVFKTVDSANSSL